VLAAHYGFTDEELDFIVNYDIKYRMGRDATVDEEDLGWQVAPKPGVRVGMAGTVEDNILVVYRSNHWRSRLLTHSDHGCIKPTQPFCAA
jgi:hypothetical protein